MTDKSATLEPEWYWNLGRRENWRARKLKPYMIASPGIQPRPRCAMCRPFKRLALYVSCGVLFCKKHLTICSKRFIWETEMGRNWSVLCDPVALFSVWFSRSLCASLSDQNPVEWNHSKWVFNFTVFSKLLSQYGSMDFLNLLSALFRIYTCNLLFWQICQME